MAPLEDKTILDFGDVDGRKKSEESPKGIFFTGSEVDTERRQRNPNLSDDDISSLTDIFQGFDIEAQTTRFKADWGNESSIELNSRDPDDDDDFIIQGQKRDNAPGLTEAFSGRSNHKGCENIVSQLGELVESVRTCGPMTALKDDKAPEEEIIFQLTVWEQAMKYFDNDPNAVPTVLSLEKNMVLYPDSSVSFADADMLEQKTGSGRLNATDTEDDNQEWLETKFVFGRHKATDAEGNNPIVLEPNTILGEQAPAHTQGDNPESLDPKIGLEKQRTTDAERDNPECLKTKAISENHQAINEEGDNQERLDSKYLSETNKATNEVNDQENVVSRRGLLDDMEDRSLDEAVTPVPIPTPLSHRIIPSDEAKFSGDLSKTSSPSADNTDEDAPRPFEELKQRRTKRSIIFLAVVLLIVTLCVGILVGTSDDTPRSVTTKQLETRSNGGITASEASLPPLLPTTDSTSSSTAPATESLPGTLVPVAESSPGTPDEYSSTTIAPTSSLHTPFPTPKPTTMTLSTFMPTISEAEANTSSPAPATVTVYPSVPHDSTNAVESVPILLPSYPNFRFVPWNNISSPLQQMSQRFLGYTETNWNLPGSANNDGIDYSSFWEAQSFATIQKTAGIEAISAVASIGFQISQWDCWVNHYQNFTWTELEHLSPISVTYVEGTPPSNTGEGTGTEKDDNVIILGRDLQMAMATLGWTETNWSTMERLRYFFPTAEEGLGVRIPWDQLSVTEQLAANMLCFTRQLWDRIPITEW